MHTFELGYLFPFGLPAHLGLRRLEKPLNACQDIIVDVMNLMHLFQKIHFLGDFSALCNLVAYGVKQLS